MTEGIKVKCDLCGDLEDYEIIESTAGLVVQTVKDTWAVVLLEGSWRAYCPECIIKAKTYVRLKG